MIKIQIETLEKYNKYGTYGETFFLPTTQEEIQNLLDNKIKNSNYVLRSSSEIKLDLEDDYTVAELNKIVQNWFLLSKSEKDSINFLLEHNIINKNDLLNKSIEELIY